MCVSYLLLHNRRYENLVAQHSHKHELSQFFSGSNLANGSDSAPFMGLKSGSQWVRLGSLFGGCAPRRPPKAGQAGAGCGQELSSALRGLGTGLLEHPGSMGSGFLQSEGPETPQAEGAWKSHAVTSTLLCWWCGQRCCVAGRDPRRGEFQEAGSSAALWGAHPGLRVWESPCLANFAILVHSANTFTHLLVVRRSGSSWGHRDPTNSQTGREGDVQAGKCCVSQGGDAFPSSLVGTHRGSQRRLSSMGKASQVLRDEEDVSRQREGERTED